MDFPATLADMRQGETVRLVTWLANRRIHQDCEVTIEYPPNELGVSFNLLSILACAALHRDKISRVSMSSKRVPDI